MFCFLAARPGVNIGAQSKAAARLALGQNAIEQRGNQGTLVEIPVTTDSKLNDCLLFHLPLSQSK